MPFLPAIPVCRITTSLLGCTLLLASAWAAPDARLQTIAEAAHAAQDQCFKHMYRDPNAYAQCLRDLRTTQAATPLKKLGTEYFAFVGALSYIRVGHMNADQIAAEFLKDYRQTQKKIGLGDAALCSTVPGDCTVRLAQTREMELAPPKAVSMRMQCVAGVCSLVPAR
ncbi:MAG: hypothetical protein HXX19_08170 [Rhodoferax sp.]|nr:hypothetical protein [Rhodoferax sp.]